MSTPAAPGADFALAPHHEAAHYAALYARKGRVHIPNLFAEADARRLFDALAFRTPWRLMLIHDGAIEMTQQQWGAMPEEQRKRIDAEVIAAGKVRFEGRFLSYRFSDEGEIYAGDPPELAALSRFLNGEAFIRFVRQVTGADEIAFADAQATLYRPGDFLHPHDDIFDIKKRHAAYVLNMTPNWKPEFGGLLAFVDSNGHIDEAFAPTWNALNLLRVPQRHFVSSVAAFGNEGRYSITGWLRRR
jgi:Rps23 Pro-64 3,4-dihydroxylase Tpa1-like proline 4-hydroxylase